MPQNDGGPAFPATLWHEVENPESAIRTVESTTFPGMSLRDWFAGQALAGELASQNPECAYAGCEGAAEVSSWAYSVADAMLAERRKRSEAAEAAAYPPDPKPQTPDPR